MPNDLPLIRLHFWFGCPLCATLRDADNAKRIAQMAQRHELTWLDADIDGEPAVPAFDMQIEYQHYLQRLELVKVESQPVQMEREASILSHRDTIACLAMTCFEGVMRDF